MRAALTAELRETVRIIRHFLPLGRTLRLTAELAAVAGLVGTVALFCVGSTIPAPREGVMIAEASR